MSQIIGTRAHELLETYLSARQDTEEQQAMRIIQWSICDALKPFDPGHIWLEFLQNDFKNYIMRIQLDNLIDDPFVLEIPSNIIAGIGFAQELGYYAAHKAYAFYAAIYIQPEDNIELGDA